MNFLDTHTKKLVSRRLSSPFRIQRYKKRGGVGAVAGRRGRFEGKINDVFWRWKDEGTFFKKKEALGGCKLVSFFSLPLLPSASSD